MIAEALHDERVEAVRASNQVYGLRRKFLLRFAVGRVGPEAHLEVAASRGPPRRCPRCSASRPPASRKCSASRTGRTPSCPTDRSRRSASPRLRYAIAIRSPMGVRATYRMRRHLQGSHDARSRSISDESVGFEHYTSVSFIPANCLCPTIVDRVLASTGPRLPNRHQEIQLRVHAIPHVVDVRDVRLHVIPVEDAVGIHRHGARVFERVVPERS